MLNESSELCFFFSLISKWKWKHKDFFFTSIDSQWYRIERNIILYPTKMGFRMLFNWWQVKWNLCKLICFEMLIFTPNLFVIEWENNIQFVHPKNKWIRIIGLGKRQFSLELRFSHQLFYERAHTKIPIWKRYKQINSSRVTIEKRLNDVLCGWCMWFFL